MPENEDALELFDACSTQWRRGAFGEPLGLDYTGVLATAKILDIPMDRTMLRKLQILEIDEMGAKLAIQTNDKPCRNAQACAMCRKNCDQRII